MRWLISCRYVHMCGSACDWIMSLTLGTLKTLMQRIMSSTEEKDAAAASEEEFAPARKKTSYRGYSRIPTLFPTLLEIRRESLGNGRLPRRPIQGHRHRAPLGIRQRQRRGMSFCYRCSARCSSSGRLTSVHGESSCAETGWTCKMWWANSGIISSLHRLIYFSFDLALQLHKFCMDFA